MGKRWLVPVSLAAAALIATGCGSSSTTGNTGAGSGSHSSAATSGNALKTAKIGGTTVLTDSKGFTLYWFVPDTSTTSKCTSSECVKFWPPVVGPVTAGAGVTGTLGTISRPDGSTQATWNGHPLYTFKGDTAPGQTNGNGQNVNGGVWHEVTLSGAPAPASSSGGGGGGGYGY
ncbi:MAG TPA: hypothetical protein VN695_21300 [Streptosporangiaceae bacterium]|nr:hypothetical protein [Streptosporangiaceae bacterium]